MAVVRTSGLGSARALTKPSPTAAPDRSPSSWIALARTMGAADGVRGRVQQLLGCIGFVGKCRQPRFGSMNVFRTNGSVPLFDCGLGPGGGLLRVAGIAGIGHLRPNRSNPAGGCESHGHAAHRSPYRCGVACDIPRIGKPLIPPCGGYGSASCRTRRGRFRRARFLLQRGARCGGYGSASSGLPRQPCDSAQRIRRHRPSSRIWPSG